MTRHTYGTICHCQCDQTYLWHNLSLSVWPEIYMAQFVSMTRYIYGTVCHCQHDQTYLWHNLLLSAWSSLQSLNWGNTTRLWRTLSLSAWLSLQSLSWGNTTHLWHTLSLSAWPDIPYLWHTLSLSAWPDIPHLWHTLSLSTWPDIPHLWHSLSLSACSSLQSLSWGNSIHLWHSLSSSILSIAIIINKPFSDIIQTTIPIMCSLICVLPTMLRTCSPKYPYIILMSTYSVHHCTFWYPVFCNMEDPCILQITRATTVNWL